jgi:Flp pilus assembly protein TadG
MELYTQFKSKLLSYRKEEDGQMAIAMAASMTVLVTVIGAAMDYSMLTNADAKSQSIADSTALAAAIFVRDNEGKSPKDQSEGLIGSYKASQLGYEFPDFVNGGASNVNVSIVYNDQDQEAVVTVSGVTTPSFAQIIGHDEIKFTSTATVKYPSTETTKPASVALVLDGSGSMDWNDIRDENTDDDEWETSSQQAGAKARNDTLKDSAKVFMKELEDLQADNSDVKILRTGMYVYSSSYHSSESETLDWGALSTSSNSKLMKLRDSGGTNSYAALKKAREDMAKENDIHKNENGDENPLKFVILMTDGVNSQTGQTCVKQKMPAHTHWERQVKKNNGKGKGKGSNQYVTEITHGRFIPWYNGGWSQKNIAANQEEETVCTPYSSNDDKTLQECSTLGAMGAKVFTIGYGLEPGYYHKRSSYYEQWNVRQLITYEGHHIHIPQEISDRAYSMLEDCANRSGGKFVAAENAQELTEAFQNIGKTIVEESIRLTQ